MKRVNLNEGLGSIRGDWSSLRIRVKNEFPKLSDSFPQVKYTKVWFKVCSNVFGDLDL
ncbi:hypothetical protein RGQ30_19970 [Limnobacter thiooxidans]|uniref:Uncharacterized protein n=1 Tax=Limnobacter thiooxidans TaxID=131080 RepID=A0AA86JG90_9BURK|nr:hypothetical protein RGQ30_19970 [Limnobacter thiooxidans]